MRLTILLFILLFSLAGCKKSIDKLKENAVITAMTDGQWIITSFIKNGTVLTLILVIINFNFTVIEP